MSYQRLFLSIAFPLYLCSFLAILLMVRSHGQDPRGDTASNKALSNMVTVATISWQLTMAAAVFDLQQVVGWGQFTLLENDAARITGIALFTLGLTLAVVGSFTLRESFRIGLPEKRTPLKTQGIYRFSRNPVILGLYAYVTGSFFIVPCVAVLAAVVLNFVFYHLKILSEEQCLRQIHGADYEAYCARVGRYLPLLPKAAHAARA